MAPAGEEGDGGGEARRPLLGGFLRGRSDDLYITLAIRGALYVNLVLFGAMVFTFVMSRSLAVLASVLDATLDLMSQGIIWYGYQKSKLDDAQFPVGTARVSPIGILVCSTLMFAGALQVIYTSAITFAAGLDGRLPAVEFDQSTVTVLIVAVCVKILLFCYSRFHPACRRSPDVQAMAQDHFNDILTNTGALSCGYVAFRTRSLWWVDAVGATVLAVYIASSWYRTGHENLRKLVGMEADEETVEEVRRVVAEFEQPDIQLADLRCYHAGNKVVVEVDMIMPPTLSLRRSHDIAVRLQEDLERLPTVERAYVLPDYKLRNGDPRPWQAPVWAEYSPTHPRPVPP